MKRFPRTSPSSLRVFTSCLLSFLMLVAPVATMAASVKAAEAAAAGAEGQRKLTADQKLESFLFGAPLPAATPDVSARMTDSFADGDADTKAEFGETITYTADITNDGPVDATGVSFNSTIDPNTEIVAGSVKVSPLAFNDTYVAVKDTALTGGASLLTNDTGQPAAPTLVVSSLPSSTAPTWRPPSRTAPHNRAARWTSTPTAPSPTRPPPASRARTLSTTPSRTA
jgi:uncharacterized repeat protein (TIGR01451 family)